MTSPNHPTVQIQITPTGPPAGQERIIDGLARELAAWIRAALESGVLTVDGDVVQWCDKEQSSE